MKRRRWLYWTVLPLLLGSCIKRQPVPEAATATAPEDAEAAEGAGEDAAPTEATGKWGQVEGEDLLGGKGMAAFDVTGETARVERSEIPVTGMPFTSATHVEIIKPSTNVWDVQLHAKIPVAVAKGDVLLGTFWFRTVKTPHEHGEGDTEFVFELGQDPWTKSVTYGVVAGPEWQQFRVPFEAVQDYGPGKAQAVLRLGYDQQTVLEFAGATVQNFKKELALADLPKTEITYGGMAEDAKWRAEAQARIEKNRQGDLEIVVKNANGAPVPNAEVHVRLERPAFLLGTSTMARLLVENDEPYGKILPELFNAVTFEYDLDWVPLSGEWGPGFTMKRVEAALQAAASRGLLVRGQSLVTPGWRHLPRSLRKQEKDPAALREAIEKHIQETVGALRGKVAHWDVVNEPYDNQDLTSIVGDRAMIDWFKAARAADPDAQLYINEYGILEGDGTKPRREHYEATIKMLLEGGAPLDGIGMQAHYGTTLASPAEVEATLDHFAKLGKPILITGFDFAGVGDEVAAHYVRDFYTVAFSHPAVQGVVMWGFWDGADWKNDAPLYARDWSPKPAAEAFRKLVLEEWRTDTTVNTGADGKVQLRGFLGDYVVEVKAGERQSTTQGKLQKGGTQLVVKL